MISEVDSARKPVSIVAIGAGNRANKYIQYILDNPDKASLVGVVEINSLRREAVAKKAGLDNTQCFDSYIDFFNSPKCADAVIISTPDNEHFQPAMMAIDKGYHVLLEKPIAQTVDECEKIAQAARKNNVMVEICYVLHFHPYFRKLYELVHSGEYGKIISINHKAPVGIDRMSHVYVRGIWNKKSTSGPLLTSKCCHDIDFITWITHGRCSKISSFGSLLWFRSENAPEGASEYCVDCVAEPKCPFSAVNLYKVRHDWVSNFDVPEDSSLDEVIEKVLREDPYGKCVYKCDNDVVDHQVLIMEYENGVTVNFTMDVFTTSNVRTTHIQLTNGEIYGDEYSIKATNFHTRHTKEFDFSHCLGAPFHAGADFLTVENFVDAINSGASHSSNDIYDAIESHRICAAAEESRLSGNTIGLASK